MADVEQAQKASPPAYSSSFVGKVRSTRQQSSGNVDFAKNCCALFMNSIGFTITLAICLALPISMIVMGAIYLDDCPYERMIPNYLLVGGCVGVFELLLHILVGIVKGCCVKDDEEPGTAATCVINLGNMIGGFLTIFAVAWFIAGNVYVYRSRWGYTFDDPALPTHCDRTLYLFAFWIITVAWIILGLAVCCGCVVCLGFAIGACCMSRG